MCVNGTAELWCPFVQAEACCAHVGLGDEIRLIHGREERAPGQADGTGRTMGGVVVVRNDAGHGDEGICGKERQGFLLERLCHCPVSLYQFI